MFDLELDVHILKKSGKIRGVTQDSELIYGEI